jgi:hypothetical protein
MKFWAVVALCVAGLAVAQLPQPGSDLGPVMVVGALLGPEHLSESRGTP